MFDLFDIHRQFKTLVLFKQSVYHILGKRNTPEVIEEVTYSSKVTSLGVTSKVSGLSPEWFTDNRGESLALQRGEDVNWW